MSFNTATRSALLKILVPRGYFGIFRSDAEETLARWTAENTFGDQTDQWLDKFAEVLGKAIVEVQRGQLKFSYDGTKWDEVKPYKVHRLMDGRITVSSRGDVLDTFVISEIALTDDGYWSYSSSTVENYCEKFIRLVELPEALRDS